MNAGMGGLQSDMQGLADGQDIIDMRDPQAIVGNMNQANMIMGSGMQQAIADQGMDPYDRLG
jgi:hypothetical protein